MREWKVDPDTGHLVDLADLVNLLDSKMQLVCFPHCSNLVAEICAKIRDAGAYRCVDGLCACHGCSDAVPLALAEKGVDVAAKLAKHGTMAGGGDFYGVRVIKALGEDPDHGVLRLSFVHYTTEAEVAKLLNVLEDVV